MCLFLTMHLQDQRTLVQVDMHVASGYTHWWAVSDGKLVDGTKPTH